MIEGKTSIGTVEQLAEINLGVSLGEDWEVRLCIDAETLQEKLQEIGYEVAGNGEGRTPVIFRGYSQPRITFSVSPLISVKVSVSRVQAMLRKDSDGLDVFEVSTPKKASKKVWWK